MDESPATPLRGPERVLVQALEAVAPVVAASVPQQRLDAVSEDVVAAIGHLRHELKLFSPRAVLLTATREEYLAVIDACANLEALLEDSMPSCDAMEIGEHQSLVVDAED